MSNTPNTAKQVHSDVCECADCIYLSPTPAQESQSESVAAPVAAVQGEGTKCCSNPRPDCMGMLHPGIGDRCAALGKPVDLFLTSKFQDHLLSQKQALSSIPAMVEKVAAIDAALHELDLFLFGEGLM